MKPQCEGNASIFPSPAQKCPFLGDFSMDLISPAELADFLLFGNSSASKTGQIIFRQEKINDKNNNDSSSSIFILDCRSTFDFENLHIKNSINIIVPSILYKRLVKGTLSTPSLISSDQARETFSRTYKTALVILVPEFNDGNGNRSNFGDRNYFKTSNFDDSLSFLLYKKLREEGCDAKFIEGGLNAFSSHYPDLCQSSFSAVPFVQSSTVDDNNGSSQSVDKRKLSSERPSSLYYLDMKSLKLDDCGSSSDETASTSGFSSSSCATSCSGESCYYGNGSCGADEPLLAPISSLSEFGDIFGQYESSNGQQAGQRFNQFQQPQNQNRQKDAKFPVEIIPHLFLGNSMNSTDREILRQYNIKYILNVTPDLPNVFENDECFHYLQIPIYDHWSQDLMVHFPTAINFIDEARHQHCGILVHCLAGISRSVTVTVAYLMRTLSLSLEDAYDLVKNHKPNIAPNLNFMGQLLDFQRDLYGENPPSNGQSTSANGPFTDSSLQPRDPFGQQEPELPFPPAPLSAPPQRRETRRTKQLAECF